MRKSGAYRPGRLRPQRLSKKREQVEDQVDCVARRGVFQVITNSGLDDVKVGASPEVSLTTLAFVMTGVIRHI